MISTYGNTANDSDMPQAHCEQSSPDNTAKFDISDSDLYDTYQNVFGDTAPGYDDYNAETPWMFPEKINEYIDSFVQSREQSSVRQEACDLPVPSHHEGSGDDLTTPPTKIQRVGVAEHEAKQEESSSTDSHDKPTTGRRLYGAKGRAVNAQIAEEKNNRDRSPRLTKAQRKSQRKKAA